MDEFRQLVDESRSKFQQEMSSIVPGVVLGEKNSKLSEEELNVLLVHAYRKVLYLQKELARMLVSRPVPVPLFHCCMLVFDLPSEWWSLCPLSTVHMVMTMSCSDIFHNVSRRIGKVLNQIAHGISYTIAHPISIPSIPRPLSDHYTIAYRDHYPS